MDWGKVQRPGFLYAFIHGKKLRDSASGDMCREVYLKENQAEI
jgi:hypothetical protein